MPNQEGEILLHGSYAQLTDQLFSLKATQQMIQWYAGNQEDVIVQKTGNVPRDDKLWLHFIFKEDRPRANAANVEDTTTVNKKRPGRGLISMRLMEFTSPTRDNEIVYTREQFIPLAEKVKAQLATPPLIWNKGKKLWSYCEHLKGLQFQVLANSEIEAKTVINACLDVRSFTFKDKFFNLVSTVGESSRYADTNDKIQVLGTEQNFPIERPVVSVTFQSAILFFPTINQKFYLYTRSKKPLNPIVPK